MIYLSTILMVLIAAVIADNANYELLTNVISPDFCDPNSPVSLSGFFGVKGSKYDSGNSKHYFYWFFEKRSNSLLNESTSTKQQDKVDKVPLLIWLNGGPGCSSMIGLLKENGPCLVNNDGQGIHINPYSWTEAAHVLYLDQPSMTGYSYNSDNTTDDSTSDMAAEDVYFFLQSFFNSDEGSKYRKLPFYLTGESAAGQYIPAIAHRIRKGNQENKHLHINLSGLAIGNGGYDREEQVKSYPEMLFHNSHGIKLITDDEYNHMKITAQQCSEDARRCKNESNQLTQKLTCQKAAHCGAEEFFKPIKSKNISVYDITKPEDKAGYVPITTFLNLNKTKQTLGIPSRVKWAPCNSNKVWNKVDFISGSIPYISETLNDGIPVLMYSGDLDYLCNYIGNLAIAKKLDWKYTNEFRSANDHEWFNGAGLARTSNGLTFLQIHDAGHMVPKYQPLVALQMMRQFINGEAF